MEDKTKVPTLSVYEHKPAFSHDKLCGSPIISHSSFVPLAPCHPLPRFFSSESLFLKIASTLAYHPYAHTPQITYSDNQLV